MTLVINLDSYKKEIEGIDKGALQELLYCLIIGFSRKRFPLI